MQPGRMSPARAREGSRFGSSDGAPDVRELRLRARPSWRPFAECTWQRPQGEPVHARACGRGERRHIDRSRSATLRLARRLGWVVGGLLALGSQAGLGRPAFAAGASRLRGRAGACGPGHSHARRTRQALVDRAADSARPRADFTEFQPAGRGPRAGAEVARARLRPLGHTQRFGRLRRGDER